ncbi:hypothetical protein ACFPOI_20560 [Nonomuraea angiospora]|uniref:Uncharacterized protein n=1 Tax=Nonomuraea angiospora TaxID=46172 RepID=A0ABR9MKR1_9ACTN|nr:hypothetical protein [Nonomuraea angiospora]MBE1593052.1 hypothetical protein [Nonomuraea angiospora]MDX3103917.1 hypothetical protein [Nonomuraea angiospora]
MHSRHLHDPLALAVVSSHRTSEGTVSYLRCDCGVWEVRTSRMVATVPPRRCGVSTPQRSLDR